MTSQLLSNMYCLHNIMAKSICFHGRKNLGIIELADINNLPNSLSVELLVSYLDIGILKRIYFGSDERI